MQKIGAVYCIYEDSGFMAESVQRLYPLMDSIIFLINKTPWNGVLDSQVLQETYRKTRELNDPDNKIVIITRQWASEAEERNYGLTALHRMGIDWCFIADEDELYKTVEIQEVLSTIDVEKFSVYLFKHQIYWKNRDTVLDMDDCYFPTILYTKPGRLTFTEARMVTVFEGKKWDVISPLRAVCHHMSYVRTDEQMLRKITNFTHVNDMTKDWYDKVWLCWKEGMINLHPVNPTSFKGTIPASQAKHLL
jgi:hypothetical protein